MRILRVEDGTSFELFLDTTTHWSMHSRWQDSQHKIKVAEIKIKVAFLIKRNYLSFVVTNNANDL